MDVVEGDCEQYLSTPVVVKCIAKACVPPFAYRTGVGWLVSVDAVESRARLPVIVPTTGDADPAFHALDPFVVLTANIESPEVTLPPTMTSPIWSDRTGAVERLTASFRIHFTRLTATLVRVTSVPGLPTKSFPVTVIDETVPVPSAVVVVTVAFDNSAGNWKVPEVGSYVTVQLGTPPIAHVDPLGSGPLPFAPSSTLNFNVYFPSPARKKCEPSWPHACRSAAQSVPAPG